MQVGGLEIPGENCFVPEEKRKSIEKQMQCRCSLGMPMELFLVKDEKTMRAYIMG